MYTYFFLKDRKRWERFREVPEAIDLFADHERKTPLQVIEEFTKIMEPPNGKKLGLSALGKLLKPKREEIRHTTAASQSNAAGSNQPGKRSRQAPVDPRRKKIKFTT